MSSPTRRTSLLIDPTAVGAGVLAALAVAVPALVVAQLVDTRVDDGAGPWLFVVLGVVLVGLGIGGYVAARRRPSVPLANGAVAALAAYAVVQAIAIVRLLVAGDPVEWAGIPLFALIALAAGIGGATVADSLGNRR